MIDAAAHEFAEVITVNSVLLSFVDSAEISVFLT